MDRDIPDLNEHEDKINEIFRYLSVDYICAAIPNDSSVLDCGSGHGAVAIPIAARGHRVTALDKDAARLENLRDNRGELPIEIVHADASSLPFKNNEFDAVTSRMFLQHLENWESVLEDMVRVTRVGGVIIFHHYSRETQNLAAQAAVSDEHLRNVLRGHSGRAMTTSVEVGQLAREFDCDIVRVTPLSFFIYNNLLFKSSLTKSDIDDYKRELSEWLTDPNVYAFVKWFEKCMISRLPEALAVGFIVVLRKK